MAIEWRDVISSNATQVGYDDETGDMLVKWSKGNKISAYAGVPYDVFDKCAKAFSVGNFLNSEIKPNYRHRYVA